MEMQNNGKLTIIGMRGCEEFVSQVDYYLHNTYRAEEPEASYVVDPQCIRFTSGEAKVVLHDSMRGRDVYIICDCFNYGATYTMYGKEQRMSPDDHFADMKRVIGAIAGKARRISVIMPMLYEGRQHKRTTRESLDCAIALQELTAMGVDNIITFDAHDTRVQNAIPLYGFDSVRTAYQMVKKFVRKETDVNILDHENNMIISPDEGGLSRCTFYSSILNLNLGMFAKRRDYTKIVNGKNPIVAHDYLGTSVEGKNCIVIDDMIASGGSMMDVCKMLKERGARKIFIFATFGLFTEGLDTFDKMYAEGKFDRIYTTNLVYRTPELRTREWYSEVNMSKYVALLIDTVAKDASTADLLVPANRIHALLERLSRGEVLPPDPFDNK